MESIFAIAVKARLPVIVVQTRDLFNFVPIVTELTGQKPLKVTVKIKTGPVKNVFVWMPYTPDLDTEIEAIRQHMLEYEGCLILVNGPVDHPFAFNAGELPVPKSMMVDLVGSVIEGEEAIDRVVQALGGCTLKEAQEVCELAMAETNSLTAGAITSMRQRTFLGNRGLQQLDTSEFYRPNEELFQYVVWNTNHFLKPKHALFQPRGIILDGPPGTGKTSAARYIARMWGVPLFRLDIGGVKSKWVGETDANLSASLARLDAEEPCVVLLDEIEKALTGSHDAGVTGGVLATLLWWLSEHRSRVLTVMTTNNIEAVPPELWREGRIDQRITLNGITDWDEAANLAHSIARRIDKEANLDANLKAIATLAVHNTFWKKENGEVLPASTTPAAIKAAVIRELKKEGFGI